MNNNADIGLIGLAVMGQNLALNIADHGHRIAVFNRSPERTRSLSGQSPEAKDRPLIPTYSLGELVGTIKKPRAIIMMVKAGDPVDQQINALLPHLDPGDVLVDGGNAQYQDTVRRERELKEKGVLFVGAGISGGEEGARHGPSIMAGGDSGALVRVSPILEAISAKVDDEPCYAHIGSDGAGHFVKMMHNGIEYADMQLIAETYTLMKDVAALSYPEMRAAFATWNKGELDSYLIEITADILGKSDPGNRQTHARDHSRQGRAKGHRRLGRARRPRLRLDRSHHRSRRRSAHHLLDEGAEGRCRHQAERSQPRLSISTPTPSSISSKPPFSPARSAPTPRASRSWTLPLPNMIGNSIAARSPVSGAAAASSEPASSATSKPLMIATQALKNLLLDPAFRRPDRTRPARLARYHLSRRPPGHPRPRVQFRARLLRQLPRFPPARQPHPGPTRLLRRPHLPTHRPRRHLPHRLAAGCVTCLCPLA